MNRGGKISFLIVGLCSFLILGLFILSLQKSNPDEANKEANAESTANKKQEASNAESDSGKKEPSTPQAKQTNFDKQLAEVQDAIANMQSAADCKSVIQLGEKALENDLIKIGDRTYLQKSIAFAHNKLGEIKMALGFEFEKIGNQKQAKVSYEQADEEFKAAIVKNNKYWKPFLNRGIVYSKLDNDEKAVANFRRSITLRPGQTFGYFNLAEVEFRRKSYVESLANYDRVLLSSKDDLQALNGRALCLIKLGRFQEAISELEKLKNKRPKDALVLGTLADAYVGLGKWKEANDTYIKALEIELHPQIYQRMAWLTATCPEETIRKPQPALFMAKKSIADSNSETSYQQWETLAAAQALSGDYEKASESQRQALLLDPENVEGKQRKALYDSEKPFVMKIAISTDTDKVKR